MNAWRSNAQLIPNGIVKRTKSVIMMVRRIVLRKCLGEETQL